MIYTLETTPNWKPLDLVGKCGSCINYIPRIKVDKLCARGNCNLNMRYKMRTESCKKYKESELDE